MLLGLLAEHVDVADDYGLVVLGDVEGVDVHVDVGQQEALVVDKLSQQRLDVQQQH